MAQNNWLEIISVRLSDPANQQAVQDIFAQANPELAKESGQAGHVELYINTKNETDWSIYLYRRQQAKDAAKTTLGLNIAEALRSLGLVNHTLWLRTQAGAKQ